MAIEPTNRVWREVGFIQLVEHPDEPQPFHIRIMAAGNSEPIVWSETYVDVRDAVHALAFLGRLFSPVNRANVTPPADADSPGWLHVWQDQGPHGEKVAHPFWHILAAGRRA